jgi:hypothetical protein
MKLVGERRAVAALVLVFYGLMLGLQALLGGVPPEMRAAIGGLAGCYLVAFFGLVAGYFWARWFAMGVALFGVIGGAVALWQTGVDEMILFYGGTHLAAVLSLWGEGMAGPFDGQLAWRERFHIDDNARHRLGKAVIRAGVSLPMVILYALAPKAAHLDMSGLHVAHGCGATAHGVAIAGIGGAAAVVVALAVLPFATRALRLTRPR